MKIQCHCGELIIDQTDYQWWSGHLISDQDWDDFLDAAASHDKASRIKRVSLSRNIYQCDHCQRLHLFNNESELVCFEPMNQDEAKYILASTSGSKWKRALLGSWDDKRHDRSAPKGFLTTGHYEAEGGSYHSWSELESAYYELFERLNTAGLLRSAGLRKNTKWLHSWPDK